VIELGVEPRGLRGAHDMPPARSKLGWSRAGVDNACVDNAGAGEAVQDFGEVVQRDLGVVGNLVGRFAAVRDGNNGAEGIFGGLGEHNMIIRYVDELIHISSLRIIYLIKTPDRVMMKARGMI